MPLCIKGKFYGKAVVVYITTAFYAIEFGVKSSCEEPWTLLVLNLLLGDFGTPPTPAKELSAACTTPILAMKLNVLPHAWQLEWVHADCNHWNSPCLASTNLM